MTTVDGEPQEMRDADCDVLSAREEGVLASLREIVRGIRGMGFAADVDNVGEAIVSAGGSALSSKGACAARIFAFGGANFSLRPAPGSEGLIEVSFIPS
jgi:hypothetical protein